MQQRMKVIFLQFQMKWVYLLWGTDDHSSIAHGFHHVWLYFACLTDSAPSTAFNESKSGIDIGNYTGRFTLAGRLSVSPSVGRHELFLLIAIGSNLWKQSRRAAEGTWSPWNRGTKMGSRRNEKTIGWTEEATCWRQWASCEISLFGSLINLIS